MRTALPRRMRRPSMLAALLLLTLTSGCARIAIFNITRPAQIDPSSVGNTITAGAIASNGHDDAAIQIAADLRDRVAHSLNPSLRLLSSGGSLQIDGSIARDDATEDSVYISSSCTRTVDDGPDANGNAQSHTESYDCSYWERIVHTSTALEFEVTDTTHQIVIFHDTFVGAATLSEPSSAAVAGELQTQLAEAVNRFSRVILPWRERVAERFEDCAGDPRCGQGFDRARSGDLETAEALFTAVIGVSENAEAAAIPANQLARIAGALYDRGVTRAYRGEFRGAMRDLRRAIALQPRQARWPGEITRVQQMQRDARVLRRQATVDIHEGETALPVMAVSANGG